VVLITTKKGKEGKTKFDFNVFTGFAKADHLKLLNTKQYLSFRREAFANDGLTPSADPNDPGYSPDLMIWDTTRYTDWQKVLMGESAQTTSVQSSISGGSEYTQILFALGYRKENSVSLGDLGYQKFSFNLAANHRSKDERFSVDINLRGVKDKNNQLAYSYNFDARQLSPNAPTLYDKNGQLNWENSTWLNPLGRGSITYSGNVINFGGNTIIGYEVIPSLQFKTSLGFNYLQSGERTKFPHTANDPAYGYTSAISYVDAASGTNQSWIIEPQLNWRRKIAKGSLTILLGSTLQNQQLERKADKYSGFPSNALLDNLAAASITSNYESVQSLYRYAALFGRLNYNWDGKYILNLSARRDGSSRFGPGKQFANFGAIGAAWIFSNESFVKNNLTFLSFGKLRASYGTTGSDQIGNYQYLDTYTTNTSPSINNQYQGVTWISPTKLFNAEYAWEVTKKREVALELGLLKDRITMEVGYYVNSSSNQLVSYTLPRITGFSGILANLGATVQNTGFEIALSSINFGPERELQWISSFNVTIPRNKLNEFPNLESSTYADRYVVGEPLSIQKVYESTGVNPETGLFTFRDVNGDGKITTPEDNSKIIFVGQNFYGGFNNQWTYKGLSLDIFFQFVKQTGGFGIPLGGLLPGGYNNVPASVLDKKIWRQPGDIAEIQRPTTGNDVEAERALGNINLSDASIVDASFVRLKNVALSYSLPKKWTKNLTCRFYFQGQNLFVITDYEGDDPESLSYASLAPLKMFTMGIHLTL
jgi:TonB-dependent starch-binding outer membrane protein SusC